MKNLPLKKIALLLCLIVCTSFVLGCSDKYLLTRIADLAPIYYINANLNTDTKTLDVVQKVNYKNNSSSILNNLKFNLHTQAFSQGAVNKPVGSLNMEKAYPNKISYGTTTFSRLSSEGQTLTYTLEETDKNILNVALLKPLKKGYSVSVEMNYTLKLPNIHHRYGYGENTINLGNFYPTLCVLEDGKFVVQPYNSNGDPFYSEMANYVVELTHPTDYIVANTGVKTKELRLENNLTKTSILAKTVRDFCMVLSNKFEVIEEKVGKTHVMYYYYEDEQYETSLKAGVDALNTFSSLIGNYPYNTLSVVKTNFVHGGMEYPNLVYVSDDIDNYEDYLNVIIHEIAHQWWYSVVGNNAYKNGWMDEGLTEYTTALFYEKNPTYNIKKEDVIKNALTAYNMFQQVYEQIFGSVDTSLTRTLGEYRTEPEYVYMAYVKSMLLFDELRQVVGDRAFFHALKEYYKTYKFKNVTPKEMIASFEKSTNKELKGWFSSWVEGRVVIRELD